MNSNSIHRRSFLRGVGTVMALPMLDAMLPSIARSAKASAASAAPMTLTPAGFPRRMGFVYGPNGVNIENWMPTTVGTDYALPTTLQPVAKFREDFSVITGLAQNKANALGDGGGDHARASATFLTGCHPKKTGGSDIRAGVSVDQIAAERVGQQTRLPSLELSCDVSQRTGVCDTGYSCAYQYNISWRSESMPMNPEVDPRLVFDRLFGDAADRSSTTTRSRRDLFRRSVLDYVMEDARGLQSRLGSADNHKMDQYLSSIREIERRLESASRTLPTLPDGVKAPPMFEDFSEHMKLMFDMLTLAFQTDSTRVFTFVISHEGGNRPYPFIGINDGHHDLSHHRNDPDKLAKIAKIDLFHMQQFAYFLEKMKSVKEGDGTLLDNSMILYGSGLSNGNKHLPTDLPILLAGRGGGTLTPGRHIAAESGTPLNNLYLSMLDRVGAPARQMGDSTGRLESIA